MKKLLLFSVATFVIASASHAQTDEANLKNDIRLISKEEHADKRQKHEDRKELKKLRGNEVSDLTKQRFNQDFGDMPDPTWERTTDFDEVTFIRDGQLTTAYYDEGANLVGTTTGKKFADIPSNAQDYINKKYRDYTVGDVLFFDDNKLNETDMSLYNLQFDDADNYFIELKKDNRKIVVQVSMDGEVTYFTLLK